MRQWLPALDLVILDMMLPDVDGEYVCAQIRELSQTLPILPYTGKEEALPVLKDLACLPALIKPVLVPRLTQSLQAAFERPTPPVTESGALRFVRAQSYKVVQEQRARLSGRRIVVIATDDYLRSWLSQMISAIAPIVRPYGVPLILIAATPIQARALVKADVHRIFLMSDPSLGAKLRAAVDGLTSGEDAEDWLVDDIANLHGSTVIPAEILRHFADTVISVRELEVLWLEYHGLERAQIAAQLSISPSTVTTHWKNVQRKLELDREGVRKWLQAHLSSTDSE